MHLDLNIEKYDSLQSLEDILEKAIVAWEKLYGAEPSERSLSLRFAGVIERACKQAGHRVVILVDEYDKPMLQSIGDEELQKEFRKTLQAFYGAIKTMDGYIRFAFLTGVTKFGKVSVFSALNNLIDLSMDERYVALCGITEEEIRTNLEQELYELADRQRMGYEEVCRELKECYDGYHFVEDSIGIYNPFSLLNTFYKMKFGNYWFETGTPTYLVELLQMHHYDLHKMAHVETDADVLNSIDSSSTNPIPVIYQSGYLTIKGYDREFGIYRLGFPNREVEEGFMKFLLPYYANTDKVEAPFEVQKFVREIRPETMTLSSAVCKVSLRIPLTR